MFNEVFLNNHEAPRTMTEDPASRFTRAEDGLRLHYLDATPRATPARTPAVCLPGLARTAEDFAPLARALATHSRTPRRVLAFDYRGRGGSDFDADWRRYDLATERADLLTALAALGIARAHMIGTSRGGLHILGLGVAHRETIASAIFNDIGPVLEPAGLARIKTYVGKPAAPKSFADAVAILKQGGGRHFDGLSEPEWRHFAETTFGRDEAALGLRYDPALARTLDTFDLGKPIPDMWESFDRLAGLPVLAIRGANSDLLSPATLATMGARWPGCQTLVVPGQGHAPLLADAPTLSRIDAFLAAAD